MRNHVFRPLLVVVALLAAFLLVRGLFIPARFGVQARGYTYGWHDLANENYWKTRPVNFRAKEDCRDCHEENAASIEQSPHAVIPCQDCHGPAGNHPDAPERLTVDTSRGLCLRCHAALTTPSSGRSDIAGVDPLAHNPGEPCSSCHNPHDPLDEAKR